MNFAWTREVAYSSLLIVASTSVTQFAIAKDAPPTKKETAASKSDSAPKCVRCCGMLLRTDFGHPDRLGEMSLQPDTVMTNCIDSGKAKGLVEAFEAYFQDIESEFGNAAQRDVVRSRLSQVFKSVVNDQTRTTLLLEGYRKFYFSSVLSSKGMPARAIEETRQARATFLKAVPADSFCLMTLDLYLTTILSENGEAAEATTIAQNVVAKARATYSKKDEFVGLALAGLGKAQLADGKPELAEASLRESMAILAEALEVQPAVYLMHCTILAEALLAQSKNAEAVELTGYLEPQLRKLCNDQLVQPVYTAVMLRAKSFVGLGKYDDAEKALGNMPDVMMSLKDPGIAGRDLLKVYVTVLEKTDRAPQAAAARKCIARIDGKTTGTSRN